MKNSNAVPDNHLFKLGFANAPDSVKADAYFLADITDGDTLFYSGRDFIGEGSGPIGKGMLQL